MGSCVDPQALRDAIAHNLRRRVVHGDVVEWWQDGQPRVAEVNLDNVAAIAVDTLYGGAPIDHVYLDPGCLHSRHDRCGQRCEYCHRGCVCPCHVAAKHRAMSEP